MSTKLAAVRTVDAQHTRLISLSDLLPPRPLPILLVHFQVTRRRQARRQTRAYVRDDHYDTTSGIKFTISTLVYMYLAE